MTRQVIHYLSYFHSILSQQLSDSLTHTRSLFFSFFVFSSFFYFFIFFISLKSITTHYHPPSTSRPQIRFKLLFKFYSSSFFFPHFFSNAVNFILAAPSQISSLSLSQDKFLMVFLYILFQSKLKALIFYTYHPIEVFLLFYFHHKFSPILLQGKSKKFVLFYSSFSSNSFSNSSSDSRTGLTVPVPGFPIELASFHYFQVFKLFSVFNDNWTGLVSGSRLNWLNQLVRFLKP